ncbi:MAG: tetratricopeptide repeat protein [Chloroflexi bacterium]|nr:tetratricopeptide repeat protein [Chloroflexota bacterium]
MSILSRGSISRLWKPAILLLFIVGGSLLVLLISRDGSQADVPPPASSTALAHAPQPTFTPTPSSTPSSTPTPTPTATPSPTATPIPSQRFEEAVQLQAEGRFDRARRLFAEVVAEAGGTPLEHEARFRLGQCYLADGHYGEAAAAMLQVLELDPDAARRRRARFLLAEALRGQGNWNGAIEAYQAYLDAGGLARAEAWERIGDAYRQMEEWELAGDAYGRAIEAAPDIPTALRLREILAQMALDRDDPEAAIAQYEAILDIARNPGYRAEILYRAGEALRMAGRTREAIQRYQAAADTAPTSPYAHRAIVALLDLEAPVDEYQRGIINYYNGVYALAVAALDRYVTANPDAHKGQAYDFMARAYHAMGQYEEAIAVWERVIEEFPQCPCWGQAWLRRAAAQAAMGDAAAARSGLLTFADDYPQHPLAAEALRQAARLLETAGDCRAAAAAYRDVQARYPTSAEGKKALFAAGMCMYRLERWTEAADDWRLLLDAYSLDTDELIAKTRLWLGKALLAAGQPAQAMEAWQPLIAQPETYYGQRARALAREAGLPLNAPLPTAPPPGPSDQEAAEEWLRSWLSDSPPGPLSLLPPELARDPSLLRGQELLALGLEDLAIGELNRLRQRYQHDPLALYRLALRFRDMGVYRLSIACAERLIALSPGPLESAPPFIQRLAYPVYFADLVEAEAAEQALDPLLVYAVIRQESLFEVSATSLSAAHGLMQVIPATGEWIATRLGWRDYRRELLYRPYVSVKFGTYYLRAALQMLDGDVIAALAGYNAGPGNALRWLERAGGDDDRFFEEITLSEPRVYVQRILSFYATYRRLYGATTAADREALWHPAAPPADQARASDSPSEQAHTPEG